MERVSELEILTSLISEKVGGGDLSDDGNEGNGTVEIPSFESSSSTLFQPDETRSSSAVDQNKPFRRDGQLTEKNPQQLLSKSDHDGEDGSSEKKTVAIRSSTKDDSIDMWEVMNDEERLRTLISLQRKGCKDKSFGENGEKDEETYKTEICSNFRKTGFCPYGSKCLYAHGAHELRRRNYGKNYKTKNFHKVPPVGHCPYGSRCRFIHDLSEMRKVDDSDQEGITSSGGTRPPSNRKNANPKNSSSKNEGGGGGETEDKMITQLVEELAKMSLEKMTLVMGLLDKEKRNKLVGTAKQMRFPERKFSNTRSLELMMMETEARKRSQQQGGVQGVVGEVEASSLIKADASAGLNRSIFQHHHQSLEKRGIGGIGGGSLVELKNNAQASILQSLLLRKKNSLDGGGEKDSNDDENSSTDLASLLSGLGGGQEEGDSQTKIGGKSKNGDDNEVDLDDISLPPKLSLSSATTTNTTTGSSSTSASSILLKGGLNRGDPAGQLPQTQQFGQQQRQHQHHHHNYRNRNRRRNRRYNHRYNRRGHNRRGGGYYGGGVYSMPVTDYLHPQHSYYNRNNNQQQSPFPSKRSSPPSGAAGYYGQQQQQQGSGYSYHNSSFYVDDYYGPMPPSLGSGGGNYYNNNRGGYTYNNRYQTQTLGGGRQPRPQQQQRSLSSYYTSSYQQQQQEKKKGNEKREDVGDDVKKEEEDSLVWESPTTLPRLTSLKDTPEKYKPKRNVFGDDEEDDEDEDEKEEEEEVTSTETTTENDSRDNEEGEVGTGF